MSGDSNVEPPRRGLSPKACVYLPVSKVTPLFVGGLLRGLFERHSVTKETAANHLERGVLVGSGNVGGEGLLGVRLVRREMKARA